jgi:copper transport protein
VNRSTTRRRLIAVVVAVSAASFVALVGSAGPVSAHASLESSDPAPSAVLEDSPDVIRLDFSEVVSPSADSIQIFDAAGEPISGGSVAVGESPTTVELTGFPTLNDGIHVVAWRVVSGDGHLVRGAFTFTVGSADTGDVDVGELIGGVLASRSGTAGVDTALVIVRWLSYLAVVIALGGAAFLVNAFVDRRRLSTLILASLAVLGLATIVHFALQGVYLESTGWSGLLDADAWRRVLDTRFGVGALVRLGLITLLVPLMLVIPPDDEARARARLGSSWWQSSTALVGAGVLVTFSVGGHPSAVPLAGVAVMVDAVHLGAVALWIGGLVTTLVAGRGRSEVVARLSRTSTYAAPIAVLTGAWQTWRIGGGFGDLNDTTWGRGMIVKIAIVIVLLALGAVARVAVRAPMRRDDETSDRQPVRVRRLVVTEVVVALTVLVASAYVVGESPVVARQPQVYSATLVQGSLIVDLTVTPGLVGNNEIHVMVSPPGGTLQRVESLEMRVTRTGDGRGPIDVEVLGVGPNHFVGRVGFTEGGEWILEVLVRPTRDSVVRFDEVIPIDDL